MINVSVPKLSLESLIDWKSYLTQIKTLFNDKCNLSKISDEYIYVSGIYQSLRLKLDENGTEAAAATFAKIAVLGLPIGRYEFKANKPFFLFIYDKKVKIPLFSAFVNDPSKT